MIILLSFIFFVVVLCWHFGARDLGFGSVLLCLSFLFGFGLVLYLFGGSYEFGLVADAERERLDSFRVGVVSDSGDLVNWLGLMEYYFAVGDFAGGEVVLDRALEYHGDNERLLELRDYLNTR